MADFAFHKGHPDAVVPKTATGGSAGFDVSAVEHVVIPSNHWKAIETGIALRFPTDCYARVAPRSGLAFKHGIDVFAGVVDADYFPNTIKVILFNHGPSEFRVNKGDRIAQIIFEKVYAGVTLTEADPTTTQPPLHAGFGSTGR